jgi:ribosomal protein S18 acetylase RimI-like enzyme
MVRIDNRPAITLYRAMGFQRVRRVPTYYMDGQDGLKMRLDFPTPISASSGRS